MCTYHKAEAVYILDGSIRNKLVLVPLKTHAQSLNMFH